MPVTSRDIENVITKFEPFIKGSSDILIIGDTPTKDNIIDGKPMYPGDECLSILYSAF